MALMVALDRSRIWMIFIVWLSGGLEGLCAKLRRAAAARTGVTLGTTFHPVISKHRLRLIVSAQRPCDMPHSRALSMSMRNSA